MVSNMVNDPAANPVLERVYARNRVGNLTGQTTELGDYAYAHDPADQLTNAVFLPSGLSGTSMWSGVEGAQHRTDVA